MYCPHTIYRNAWDSRNMRLPTFEKLIPAFKKAKLVYLQGWGEPFMNINFFDMVKIAKRCGCQVGTSTNGMLLNLDKIEMILEYNLDLIAFSLTGINTKHDKARSGTSFDEIIQGIKTLDKAKRDANKTKPEIHIAYLLLKSDMENLEKLPETFKDTGVSQIVISTLDFIPDENLKKEAIRPRDKTEYNKLSQKLDEIAQKASENNIAVHYSLPHPDFRRPVCTENARNSFFAASDGSISPCVFTNIPVVGGEIEDITKHNYMRLSFGNIHEESIASMWNSKEYKEFRDSFESESPHTICLNCPKLYIG